MQNLDSVCYINRISKIEAIQGSDNLELATINGWTSVVQKDIHKAGNLILCVTTDAIIPQELADKWGVSSYLRKGSRVRTVKLRGVYSECILIPIVDIPVNAYGEYVEGSDLMEMLNIFKYEPPVREVQLVGGRRVKQRDNPNFNKYYKFPNQKNVPNMFSENDEVVITRKIHGTNARYGIVKKAKLSIIDRIRKFFGNKWVEYEYVYGSHNVIKGSDTNGFYSTDVWRTVANKLGIEQALWKLVKSETFDIQKGIIIYGEVYGPGIQGDKYSYKLKDITFAGFDIEVNQTYLNYETKFITFYSLNLPMVETLYQGSWSKEVQDKRVLNQFIEGTKVPHEGVVVTCISGDRRKISKVINPDYHTFSEKHLVPDSH